MPNPVANTFDFTAESAQAIALDYQIDRTQISDLFTSPFWSRIPDRPSLYNRSQVNGLLNQKLDTPTFGDGIELASGVLQATPSEINHNELLNYSSDQHFTKPSILLSQIGEAISDLADGDFLKYDGPSGMFFNDGLTESDFAVEIDKYTQEEIDDFFAGESVGGKKQIDWVNILSKPAGLLTSMPGLDDLSNVGIDTEAIVGGTKYAVVWNDVDEQFEVDVIEEADISDLGSYLKTDGSVAVQEFLEFAPQGSAPTAGDGKLFKSSGLVDTMSYYNSSGVKIDVNQNMFYAVNQSGAAISKGQVVYVITGSFSDDRLAVDLSQADVDTKVNALLGVCLQASVANGAIGCFVTLGYIQNINTSSWSAGDVLYIDASEAGALTNTAPAQNTRFVGYVTKSHASTGSIFVAFNFPQP